MPHRVSRALRSAPPCPARPCSALLAVCPTIGDSAEPSVTTGVTRLSAASHKWWVDLAPGHRKWDTLPHCTRIYTCGLTVSAPQPPPRPLSRGSLARGPTNGGSRPLAGSLLVGHAHVSTHEAPRRVSATVGGCLASSPLVGHATRHPRRLRARRSPRRWGTPGAARERLGESPSLSIAPYGESGVDCPLLGSGPLTGEVVAGYGTRMCGRL